MDFPDPDYFMGVWVYTFEACIYACASYNLRPDLHLNSTCTAVSYNDAVTSYVQPPHSADGASSALGGNCFLKTIRGVSGVHAANISSAVLAEEITD